VNRTLKALLELSIAQQKWNTTNHNGFQQWNTTNHSGFQQWNPTNHSGLQPWNTTNHSIWNILIDIETMIIFHCYDFIN